MPEHDWIQHHDADGYSKGHVVSIPCNDDCATYPMTWTQPEAPPNNPVTFLEAVYDLHPNDDTKRLLERARTYYEST